ncbi:MAG: DegT/DnrJ/EryC1/StrS family aminotransferase [Acidobacteriia bacterium]|nr:DegT/DnrJ/EryC1/StrS family aminotransferase [Terriglobia bacterium]
MSSVSVARALVPFPHRDVPLPGTHPIPLSSPDVSDDDRERVLAILNGTALSLGPALPAFEAAMAEAAGTRFAVAVNSGTSALHLCIKAAEIGEGDEVITTPFSFVASANCALYERAIPRFVDIDIDTYNIDPAQIGASIGRRTRAILPVHVFGRPCDMSAITDIAARHDLAVIEDSCEAIGATYDGRKIGSFGHSGSFAFYPNKQITTGEGGAVVTNDEHVARVCRSWRNQGRGEGAAWLQHERLGYNYRLSDINCALGLGQLSRLDLILQKRRAVARAYEQALEFVPEVITPAHDPGMSWFVYVVRLQDEFTREDRDRALESLRGEGIGCSNYFSPIHLQAYFREMFGYRRGDFPVTEHVADRTIALPFFNNLSHGQIDMVAAALARAIGKLARTF